MLVLSKLSADFLAKLASSSLEDGNQAHLWCVLLLARQAALEGPHVFPSYASWFKVSVTFFLIQCMTVNGVPMGIV